MHWPIAISVFVGIFGVFGSLSAPIRLQINKCSTPPSAGTAPVRARPRPIELRTRSRGIGDRGPGDRRADSHGGHGGGGGGGGGRASAMTSAQSKDVWTGKLNSVRWWVPSRISQFACGYRGALLGSIYAAMVRLWVPDKP